MEGSIIVSGTGMVGDVVTVCVEDSQGNVIGRNTSNRLTRTIWQVNVVVEEPFLPSSAFVGMGQNDSGCFPHFHSFAAGSVRHRHGS